MEDPIQNLLSTTGWSYDDLLEKIQKYKNLSKNNNNEKAETNHSSQEGCNGENAAEKNSNAPENNLVNLNSDAKVDICLQNGVEKNFETKINGKCDKKDCEKLESNTEKKLEEDILQKETENFDETISLSNNAFETKKTNQLPSKNTNFDLNDEKDEIISLLNSTETFQICNKNSTKETNEGLSKHNDKIIPLLNTESSEISNDEISKEKPSENPNLDLNDKNTEIISLLNDEIKSKNINSTTDNEGNETVSEIFNKNSANKVDEKNSDQDEIILLTHDDVTPEMKNENAEKIEQKFTTINDCVEKNSNTTETSKIDETVGEKVTEKSGEHVFLKPTATVKEFSQKMEEKKALHRHEHDDYEPEPEPKHNEEELRNLLRMQISQLRNKKKMDVIGSNVDKNILTRDLPESKKKKRKLSVSEDENPPSKRFDDASEEKEGSLSSKLSQDDEKVEKEDSCITAEEKVEDSSNNKKDDLDNVLLSNESEFLIVNVVGGYKSPENEPEKEPETNSKTRIINEHLDGQPINLNKAKNYKDIKGWQRKKILVNVEDMEPRVKIPFDDAVPSCSYANVDEELGKSRDTPKVDDVTDKRVKSAFESNFLDQFLVENSQLNISYEVPKLDAEENITHDELLVPVKSFDSNEDKNSDLFRRKFGKYKPKTLAEKRKLLQSMEKRQAKERERIKECPNEPGLYFSRIYYRGKIIKVRTREPYAGYFYYITRKGASKMVRKVTKPSYYVTPKHPELEKPSLLTCLKAPEKVSYKPGPLSMKNKLQIQNTAGEWTTVIKSLPKISLEVTPEYGKPLDPRIVDYIQYPSEILTEERLDFALTAVKSAEPAARNAFRFPLAYKNDEKFLLFRKQQRPPDAAAKPRNDEDDETAVKTVIDKLLNYVEIAEIADDLIKPDTERRDDGDETDGVNRPLAPISVNVGAIIKNSKKRKTNLELRRLNVKIIDVDVAVNENASEFCSKPYCKLGCVCKSLECSKSYNFHCGNAECMLDCKCNFRKLKLSDEKVILPAGTDILSVGTVSHLQDQAKKHLAKEEKEFVQTVIQANDQTIVLGTGSRDRQKRAKKLPRKMSDYVPHHVLTNIDEKSQQDATATKETYDRDIMKTKWTVELERLDLREVVPFCLVHGLYDCHCNFQAPYPVCVARKPPKQLETIDDETNETVEEQRESSPEHCSRTLEVSTEAYRIRNSAIGYLDTLRRNLADKERSVGSTEMMKPAVTLNPSPPKSYNKRKQQFDVRDDEFLVEKAIQRRKKRISIGSNSATELRPVTRFLENTVLETRIQPRSLIEELSRYLGKDSMDKTQLLPWETLVDRYQDGSLQLWCNLRAKKMLITEHRIRPSKTYVNVDYIQYSVKDKETIDFDLIRCLITGTVPKNKDPKEVLLVLTFKTTHYEVCGICEKSNSSENVALSLINTDLNEDATTTETFLHRTIDDVVTVIPLKRATYQIRRLVYDVQRNDAKKVKCLVYAPLPDINERQRWCMILLTKHCYCVTLKTFNYNIKKSDLIELIAVASDSQQTLILDGRYFDKNNKNLKYTPPNVYVVPNYNDRVFFGPVMRTENPKIEICDFNRKTLVRSELFHKTNSATNCYRLRQIQDITKEKPTVPDLVVIDDDDDDEKSNQNNDDGDGEEEEDDDDVVLVQDKQFISQINNQKRYFVTNVRGLGYLEGTQLIDSKIIDVRWPFSNNIQRYSKLEDAIGGIQRQLNSMLIPVPKSFQLKVSVVDAVDRNMSLMKSQYAQGHYAIGEFGVCNLLSMKPCDFPFPGGLNEDIIEMLLHRSAKVLFHNCMKLTETFTPNIHSLPYQKIQQMLDGATKEIKHQESTFENLSKAKNALELKKIELEQKIQSLQNEQEEDGKIQATTTTSSDKNDETILIEISDDEDEKKPPEASPKKTTNETLIKIQSPSRPTLITITNPNNLNNKTINGRVILPKVKNVIPLEKKSLFTTKRSLVKVPISGILSQKPQRLMFVRESNDPEIIKRLKNNSGLQVSVLNNNKTKELQFLPSQEATTPATVQTCEIVTVNDNNGVKSVELKRRIPVHELQYLVKKQLGAIGEQKKQ